VNAYAMDALNKGLHIIEACIESAECV